ncbi:hypothetical protein Gotri_005254 [Gossypium trilobum]|uniref:BHLH domain-containing protein n=1 Tax=Gossypium trilobum TaxID=34281 RepID=A0A7J9EVX6_9ROSI|nr:hypothetical protein [Gossypium trilobum]
MVCQAASQTRFRALKYENGIAGSATIVVRVIACFQPLQDCQMREGCGFSFPQQRFDWRSHDLSSLAAPHPLVQQNTNPQLVNSGIDMVSVPRTLPDYANPGIVPQLQVGQVNEPCGWFYCSPHYWQGLVPASTNPYEYYNEKIVSKAGSGCAQKRFLVFDQSGDQTTMIFSSSFGTPIKCATWGSKSPAACNFNGEDPITKVNPDLHSGPISSNVFDENGTNTQSEMHEDTEELNALLYSDDDSYYTDDEVTSAVHSPSRMTACPEQFEGGGTEKVASSIGPTKKRKLLNDGNDYLPLLTDAAISVNPSRCSEYVDDADSSCANMESSSSNKRLRIEKIQETVSVLRSLIPNGEGKDAIMVLDEAIDYLKSLKLRAKTLGLNAL